MAVTFPLLRELNDAARMDSESDNEDHDSEKAHAQPGLDIAASGNETQAAARASGIAEMFAEAHANAPRSGGVRLAWMSIAEAAAVLRIRRTVLSSWATRGYIASVKGDGANDHRYLHLDNVLHFLADRMTAQDHTSDSSTNVSNGCVCTQ